MAREVSDAVSTHCIAEHPARGSEGAAQRVVQRAMETRGWIILGGLASIF